MKILVVDDSEKATILMRDAIIALRGNIDEILLETNPLKAFQTAFIERPDMLFIDRMMDEYNMSGPELREHIALIKEYDPFCVLISSAQEYSEGFDLHIGKFNIMNDVSHAFEVLKRRKKTDEEYWLEYLKDKVDSKHIKFLTILLQTQFVEKHKFNMNLFLSVSRNAELYEKPVLPTSVQKSLKLIVNAYPDFFCDGKRRSPRKFIEDSVEQYYQFRLFGA